MNAETQQHWNSVYTGKSAEAVSWYQAHPQISLELIAAANPPAAAPIIDVGGGASSLVDCLLERGHTDVSVLDVSAAALATAQSRLGANAARVSWIETDIRRMQSDRRYQLWHDRALFHFLATPADRAAYVATLRRSVDSGADIIVATFALDGPPRCSGLDVMRYDAPSLHAQFGDEFELMQSQAETHTTPRGVEQRFTWVRMRMR